MPSARLDTFAHDRLPLPRRRTPEESRARWLEPHRRRLPVDDDGHFHCHARTDDMIVSAGHDIAGPEVEEALLQHSRVAERSVARCKDTRMVAFVERPPRTAAGKLQRFRLRELN